jgi:hypothetical protein
VGSVQERAKRSSPSEGGKMTINWMKTVGVISIVSGLAVHFNFQWYEISMVCFGIGLTGFLNEEGRK